MIFKVYMQSQWIKRWRFCGRFNEFTQANEHVDYLLATIPDGYKVKFRLTTEFRSFDVNDI